MYANEKVSGTSDTLRVKGSLSMIQLNNLRETLLKSISSAKHVVLELEHIEDVSFACLQLLCSTCRTAYLLKKKFTIDSGACVSFKKVNVHMDYMINMDCSFAKNGCSLQDGLSDIENHQVELKLEQA